MPVVNYLMDNLKVVFIDFDETLCRTTSSDETGSLIKIWGKETLAPYGDVNPNGVCFCAALFQIYIHRFVGLTLNELIDAKVKIVLLSNGGDPRLSLNNQPIVNILRHYRLYDKFNDIIIKYKHNVKADSIKEYLRLHKLSLENALFIDDDTYQIHTATSAGIKSIHYGFTPHMSTWFQIWRSVRDGIEDLYHRKNGSKIIT